MPLVAFVGDVHGDISAMYVHLRRWEDRTGCKLDAVVQVGDFGMFPTSTDFWRYWNGHRIAPIETYVIAGNHECPGMIRNWQKEPDRIPRMHLIPDGGVVEVLGKRIAGVWGCYSPISWEQPDRVALHRSEHGNSERIAMHIHRPAVEHLMAEPFDILVTHDSAKQTLPSQFHRQPDEHIKRILGLQANERAGGCGGFDGLIDACRPDYYYFGHLHHTASGAIGRTKWKCLNALQCADNFFEVVEW